MPIGQVEYVFLDEQSLTFIAKYDLGQSDIVDVHDCSAVQNQRL